MARRERDAVERGINSGTPAGVVGGLVIGVGITAGAVLWLPEALDGEDTLQHRLLLVALTVIVVTVVGIGNAASAVIAYRRSARGEDPTPKGDMAIEHAATQALRRGDPIAVSLLVVYGLAALGVAIAVVVALVTGDSELDTEAVIAIAGGLLLGGGLLAGARWSRGRRPPG